MALPIVRSVAALREAVAGWRRAGDAVALVPTMGALHDGHLSLVAHGRRQCRRVVATIFVNPKQFGPKEDFAAYPRQEAADAAKLEAARADLLFAPTVDEMYPAGFATTVSVGGLGEGLCGAARPGHFDGVATVVSKLLLQALPDVAVFGEKDWQQLQIIRRLARDLDIPVRIDGVETLREADGLAMSSRNAYLTPEERAAAPALNRALRAVAAAVAGGGEPAPALAAARRDIAAAGFQGVDYLEIREAESLRPAERRGAAPLRVFGAAFLGRARLIDNVPV
ncbi:MAG TPA: pantoate--beta-alanine ligase [Alphaproteobacteria bacterium]|nr:pantoate--beta-alanine ligase [Alphaproteobacteria bacterium]